MCSLQYGSIYKGTNRTPDFPFFEFLFLEIMGMELAFLICSLRGRCQTLYKQP